MPLSREPYGFLDAALRYNRAREHLADVERMLETFKATPRDVGLYIEAESLEEWLTRKRIDMRSVPIPYDLPIRIGEAAYNLRCALDYLIFALAWHDSGIEPTGKWARRLQFPVEDSIEVFERRRATMLKGISDEHVAMVREYQPGEGCDWTEVLIGLSDSDKHRHLALLAGSFDFEGETGTWIIDSSPYPDAEPNEDGLYAMHDVDVKDRATLDIVFPDGSLATETLQEIETQVGKVLLRFGREFKLHP
ncbi:MAG: hypothetical protein ACRD3V_00425, partial [Vicinamibacteria bacterium]